MTTAQIAQLLAQHLEGMRVKCDCQCHPPEPGLDQFKHKFTPICCQNYCGYVPAPLTAEVDAEHPEGHIDEGRLRRALEAHGFLVQYRPDPSEPSLWCLRGKKSWAQHQHDPDLALAALKALGVDVEEAAK